MLNGKLTISSRRGHRAVALIAALISMHVLPLPFAAPAGAQSVCAVSGGPPALDATVPTLSLPVGSGRLD